MSTFTLIRFLLTENDTECHWPLFNPAPERKRKSKMEYEHPLFVILPEYYRLERRRDG